MAHLGKGTLWKPAPTEKINANLYAINDKGDLNLFVYTNDGNAICVDCGYWSSKHLANEFGKVGLSPAQVSHLLLTHADMDHGGGIDCDSKTNWFKHSQVYISEAENDIVNGIIPRKRLAKIIPVKSPAEITQPMTIIKDGDIIEVGSIKVEVIATPGHTPGHVSYLINHEVLCTGDTLNIENGKVKPFYKFWNMDHEMDIKSVKKLAKFENVSTLCTAHTGWIKDWDNAIAEWR
jgi:glyoxylase-like metal-dependent hydrolase (beta-lactamase superfamily II)